MKKLIMAVGTGLVMLSLYGVPVYANGDPPVAEADASAVAASTLPENPEPVKEDDHTPISFDGTGTVIDNIENGSKHFYTISTDAGNVFYLIVDLDKENNNVYFLDTTKERDLIALAEKAEEEDGIVEIKEQEPPLVETPAPEPPVEEEPEPKRSGVSPSFWITLILIFIGGGGVVFYYWFYKPRKDADEAEEFDEACEFDDGITGQEHMYGASLEDDETDEV